MQEGVGLCMRSSPEHIAAAAQAVCSWLISNHTTDVAVGFGLGLRTRLWATSSRLILRNAVHRLSMLALSLPAQSDRSAQTGCSSWRKALMRSSSYPRRPARLHQSLSSMWPSPSPPLNSIFSTFSLVCSGRSKQGSSSMVRTAEGEKKVTRLHSVNPGFTCVCPTVRPMTPLPVGI